MTSSVKTLTDRQKTFFYSGKTKSVEYRIRQLRRLKQAIRNHEASLLSALNKDLGKHEIEAYSSDLAPVLHEIDLAVRSLKKWAAPRKVKTPWLLFPAVSRIRPEPLGSVLIIGAWNYPVQLVLSPLAGAMAAGNCAVVKPSEISPHTSRVLAQMIKKTFDETYIAAVEGGVRESGLLLDQAFDFCFFTGSVRVGKIVMAAAARHLTPVTLELGGKNPCIVHADCNIDIAAKRITWGKFINAGQTCIAPDYLWVHESVKQPLVAAIKKCITRFYSTDPSTSPDFGRIINDSHVARLLALMEHGRILAGGNAVPENRYIAPTIMDKVNWEHDVMQEEIFGPILPVLTYDSLGKVIRDLQPRPSPLALYFFSNSRQNQARVIGQLPSGGACINDTFAQAMNAGLPFGGTGNSGMGAYHGKHSFNTFSHARAVVTRKVWADPGMKYPPYTTPLSFLKKGLRFLY